MWGTFGLPAPGTFAALLLQWCPETARGWSAMLLLAPLWVLCQLCHAASTVNNAGWLLMSFLLLAEVMGWSCQVLGSLMT